LVKIPDRIDSKFRYVLLSAARAEQLIQGTSPAREEDAPKVTRLAMDEIASDAIAWDYGPPPEPENEEGADAGETEEASEEGEA
jgi:DNA-directed RNA polymerase omega subunit